MYYLQICHNTLSSFPFLVHTLNAYYTAIANIDLTKACTDVNILLQFVCWFFKLLRFRKFIAFILSVSCLSHFKLMGECFLLSNYS